MDELTKSFQVQPLGEWKEIDDQNDIRHAVGS
jgi:hypothetical protein